LIYLSFFFSQGGYEFISTGFKNCGGENAIVKVLPNSTVKIDKDCLFTEHVCHNYTTTLKPQFSNTKVYQRSLKIFDIKTQLDCKNLKKINDRQVSRIVSSFSGLILKCNQFSVGIKCYKESFMLDTALNTIKMLSVASKDGDLLRITDEVSFDKGKSCVEVNVVMKKY
jgi:hypothetical protein